MQNAKFSLIYLLLGQNEHAKTLEVDKIKAAVLGTNLTEFNFDVLYADETEPKNVVTLCNTLPFGSEVRLVLLKRFEAYSAKEKNILAEYSKDPAPQTCLVICDGEKPAKNEAWYKTFDANKTSVQLSVFWPYNYKMLTQLIIDSLKKFGKNIDYNAASVLAELIETNPNSLDEEIKKIINYVGEKNNVSLDDIKANVLKSQNHDIYEWAIKITDGKTVEALKFLNNFSPTELKAPQLLLFVLTERFTKIFKYLTLLSEGVQSQTAQKSLGVMLFLDPKFAAQATRYDFKKLAKIFDLLINVDANIKVGKGEPKFLLEELIVDISRL